MSLTLSILIGLLVAATSVAVYAWQLMRERRAVLGRLDPHAMTVPVSILRQPDSGLVARVADWLRGLVPASFAEPGAATARALMHAGYDGPAAPLIYLTLRFASAVLLPLLAMVIAPRDDVTMLMAYLGVGVLVGLMGPRVLLDGRVKRRQDGVRKSIPDCLDLMVVCVEAGVSLDAAMLRGARDMATAHPDLSGELLVVNRRMNAGITRDEAVTGLWHRTGVEELRGLATSMIQSERLGTSIARVLRVYSETLRRKRKQAAEKKAAEAGLKMLIPLALFLLPALFAIILGPVAIKARDVFGRFGGM